MPEGPHVKIGSSYYRIDTESEVPFRRFYDSLMQPRTDVSGVPGAINLQRDVWLWQMSDFAGGEGREVFDSSDPLGPPTYWKTDGGVDTRIRGEFSLHPDEQLITNDTGGSAPTVTSWTNTGLTTLAGTPTFSAGPGGVHVRLAVGDSVRTGDRTPGAIPVRVWTRVVNARCKPSNKKVTVTLTVRNTTDGVDTTVVTKQVRDNEPATLQYEFTAEAGHTYRYYVANADPGTGVTVDVKAVKEQTFAATITPNDFRDIRLGVGDNIWAAAYDTANTDILRWNFTNDTWDSVAANVYAAQPRCLTGSDESMYVLLDNGRVYKLGPQAEQQTITISGQAGTDSFNIVAESVTTTNFVFAVNMTAAAIQAALRTATGDGGLIVTGTDDAGPFVIEWSEVAEQAQLSTNVNGMTATVTTTRAYSASAATYYAAPPTSGSIGTPLSVVVADNRLWALYAQALYRITLDGNTGLPYTEGSADYTLAAAPGEFPREASPDTTLRQHMTGTPNGVRFFTNVRGSQTAIYEYNNADQALSARWMLPTGYVATAIHHYANITFIAASFTNSASSPAESRAGIFYVGSDELLRFIGYLRFSETNSQPVRFIDSYGHDVYFLQGGRRWRYSLGSGGLTLENVASCNDETKARAMASMDKKFWMAYQGEGTFVADDSYPTTTMWLYSPVWDFDLPDTQKVLLSFDIVTAPLPSNTRIDLEYRLDEAETWTAASSITTAATVKTRMSISTSSSTSKFTTLQWRVGLTSLDGVDTPRVRSVTPRAYILDYEKGFDFTILLDDDTSTDRMRTEQRTGRQKAVELWTIIDNKNLVAFEDHFSSKLFSDKDSYTVILEDPFQHLSDQGESALRLRAKVVS